jgi:hypothetical protein
LAASTIQIVHPPRRTYQPKGCHCLEVAILTRICHHEAGQGIDPLIHWLIEPLKSAILFFNDSMDQWRNGINP